MSTECWARYLSKSGNIGKFTVITSISVCSLLIILIILNVAGIFKDNDCIRQKNCHSSIIRTDKLTDGRCLESCTTNDCIHAASSIMEKVDPSVDPCEDIYQFSCGNWLKKYGKNDDVSVLDEPEELLKLGIKEILDELKPTPGTAMHKMKTVYDSCLNKAALELNSVPSALEHLETFGLKNWPRLEENFRFGSPSLEEVIASLSIETRNMFVRFYPDLDKYDESYWYGNGTDPERVFNFTVSVSTSSTGFDGQHKIVFTEILSYFELDDTEINQTIEDFMKMSSGLGKISHLMNDRTRVRQRSEMNCTENDDAYTDFICKIAEYVLKIANVNTTYSTNEIKIRDNLVLHELYDLLKNNSHRTIGNYIALEFFFRNVKNLNFYFFRLLKKYPDIFRESTTYPFRYDRWRHCVEWVTKHMAPALALAYVPKNLPQDARDEIKDIFEVMKSEMVNVSRNKIWIQNDVLISKIWQKLSQVCHFIEKYMDYVLDEERVNRFYQRFDPTTDSYLTNMIGFQRLSSIYVLDHFIPYENIMFDYDPFIVNAYHMEGQLDLLFGILLPPMYTYGRPWSLNLATLGMNIGHELGHEMGDIFGDFIHKSDYKDAMEDFLPSYNARKKCLVDQYDGYTVKQINMQVNGTFTFTENFADYFAIVALEHAQARQLAQSDKPEVQLPVPFTADETFYISYAQIWCAVSSDKEARMHVTGNMHSPSNFRVLGALSNSAKFSEVFKCVPGSPMNPVKKCSFLQ